MSQIGYARVSATDPNTDLQHERLKAAGCEIVRLEKVSGKSRDGRPSCRPSSTSSGPVTPLSLPS